MIGIVLNIRSPAALFEVALVSILMSFGKVQMPSKHKMRKTPWKSRETLLEVTVSWRACCSSFYQGLLPNLSCYKFCI